MSTKLSSWDLPDNVAEIMEKDLVSGEICLLHSLIAKICNDKEYAANYFHSIGSVIGIARDDPDDQSAQNMLIAYTEMFEISLKILRGEMEVVEPGDGQ